MSTKYPEMMLGEVKPVHKFEIKLDIVNMMKWERIIKRRCNYNLLKKLANLDLVLVFKHLLKNKNIFILKTLKIKFWKLVY